MATTFKGPRYLFGFHDLGGEHLIRQAGKRGWVLVTEEIGHNHHDHSGKNYTSLSQKGFGVIVRLNNGYGAEGTIPLPEYYDDFAARCGNFVAASPGCHIWIIGNEMNHEQERPQGALIIPEIYVTCYKKCRREIKRREGHEDDQVVAGAVAPYNNTTKYPGNESGDWIKYFTDILEGLGEECDGIALHTYTHGPDPELIFSERRMDPPFDNRHFDFRAYVDFMEAIPLDMRTLPVYITETDQCDEPWADVSSGWVKNAYEEIANWNLMPGHQQIRCLLLYRWSQADKWNISGKEGVIQDFRKALEYEYVWRPVTIERRLRMNFKKIGIDANVPLNPDGSISPRVKNPSIIADIGANWVRINFVLGPWTFPTDSGWAHAYDKIIGGLVDKGLKVYGLIGCEAVHDPPDELFRYGKSATPAETAQAAHAWIDQYAENFAAIVERFRAKVQVYESFNEPDDWHGWQPKPDLPNPHWIHPYWFATMLERIFQEVKRKRGYDDITLVSGPLQGLEINGNESPKRYLDQTYYIGKTIFGWRPGSYPFDGVGYHLYVKEEFEEDWAEAEKAIQETYKTYLDGIWGVIAKHEGEETDKKLYVSEFGWRSIDGSLMEHEELQAKKLETAIRILQPDPRVGVAIWFCLQDFDVPHKSYGLYKSTGLRPEDRKRPAYNALKRLCPKWPLLGKGFWIWKLDKCEGGDVKAIVEKAKSAALAHVLVKIADGSRPYNGDLAPLVDALHAAGVGVWGWQYTYGTDPGPKEEAEMAVSRVRQFGLDGFAIDAEVEYKGHPERATEYINALRDGLPDVPIALSSFYLPDYHPDFPWQEFLTKCDLNMPQIYWFSRDPIEALKRSLAQHGEFRKPIFPTGAAYRMTDTSATPSQIQSFLEAVKSEGLIGVNFWSWQHATSEMWDVIKGFDWPKEGAQPCIPPSEEISQLREQLEATKAELDAARETIARLQDQLNVKSSELEDLRRSCAELEAKSNETISQLREQLEATKAELDAARETIAQLQDQLNVKSSELEDLRRSCAELEAARETIGKLQTKLAKLGWLANLGRLFRRGGGD